MIFAFRYPLALLIAGILMVSCTRTSTSAVSEGENPKASKEGPGVRKEDQARLDACIQLAQRTQGVREYQLIANGSVAFEQTHKILIEPLKQEAGYLFRELYNTFSSEEDESVEYYMDEFLLRVEEMGTKHLKEDFRIVVKEDTAYTYSNDHSAFHLSDRRELTTPSHSFVVFQLLGYQHSHSEEEEDHEGHEDHEPTDPSFYQYWNPQLGTVLVRYADGNMFELVKTERAEDQSLITELKIAIKDWDSQ